MPTFEKQLPDGRTVTADGEKPPTEEQWGRIVAAVPKAAQPQPDASTSAALTGGAYALGQAAKALPAVNTAASYVAKTPLAQKAIATGIGAATGAATGGTGQVAMEGLLGERFSDLVGKGAKMVEKATQATKATVGRNPVTGQFTAIAQQSPSWLKTIFDKLGPSMGLMSSEAAALNRLNSPEEFQKFVLGLKPEYRAEMMKAYMKAHK